MQVLDFVRDYVHAHNVAPSRPEIAGALSITHVSTVDSHLQALERKGWVELKTGSARYIRLLKDDLPLIIAGPIAAGAPILAEEHVTERIPRSMAAWFPRQPDFFVRVVGDSLDRLGIVTGTVIAVKAQPTAESGELVVARIEEEVTLKRFVQKDEKHAELLPESTNREHQPIEVDLKQDGFEIAGVAVGALIGDGFNRPEYENWGA